MFSKPGTGDCGDWTDKELLEIMENRIKSYVKYTKDVAVAWNVVNEVFKEDGSFADFCWYRVLGEQYIDYAFKYAREATPDGLLVFNDNFGNGRMSRVEIDAVFDYIKRAKKRGVPIDAFGLQNHLYSKGGEQFSQGYLEDLQYFFAKAEDAGVKVLITEMDVYQANYSDEEVKKLYRSVVANCLKRDNCISFSTWGVDDESSWLRGPKRNLTDARPLLFDSNFFRKPAYYGTMWAIRLNETRSCSVPVKSKTGPTDTIVKDSVGNNN